jgi:uncharacterized protein YkwD
MGPNGGWFPIALIGMAAAAGCAQILGVEDITAGDSGAPDSGGLLRPDGARQGDDGGQDASADRTVIPGPMGDATEDGFATSEEGPTKGNTFEGGPVDASDGATSCPPPPSGVAVEAANALNLINQTRSAMGSPCATMVPALNTSAQKHCTYYSVNSGMPSCIANLHVEVSSCTDYVAAQFADRELAAGYAGTPSAENMAFVDNGAAAVQTWLDSVWHRMPVLSPWDRDLGYGSQTNCDTMDFGVGAATAADLVVSYPYDGQTAVPISFNGANEAPNPPAPPSGWPSGYPISVFISQGVTITTHEFGVQGGAMLSHEWITSQTNSLAQNVVILYGDAPLTSATTYTVHVAGTGTSGSVDKSFTFTTR